MHDYPKSGSHYVTNDNTVPPSVIAGRTRIVPSTSRGTLRFLPVALGAVAGVILVIVAVELVSHRSDAAQPPAVAPIARQICSDLTAQRYDALYGLLAPTQQAIGSSSQFAASQRQLDAQLGVVRACVYSVTAQNTQSATLTLTLTRGASPGTVGQVQLIYDQKAWRIADYDSSLVAAPGDQRSGV